jgi:hypothetical protein
MRAPVAARRRRNESMDVGDGADLHVEADLP